VIDAYRIERPHYSIVGRFERGLCPRPELGEASEGAAEAPSDKTMRMSPYAL
jgi:hypothetical protein